MPDNQQQEAVERAKAEADRALAALYLEVPESIAADVYAKVHAYGAALVSRLDKLETENAAYRMGAVVLKCEYVMLKTERDQLSARLTALSASLLELDGALATMGLFADSSVRKIIADTLQAPSTPRRGEGET